MAKSKIWRFRLLKSLGITALAFLLSFILVAPFSASLSAIFSTPEKTDFTMSDMFVQVADARPVRQFDDRIVVIDIGHSGREEIASLLDLLTFCEPKAVGLDVNFALPKEDDSHLIESILRTGNLVLPVGLDEEEGKFSITEYPFFIDSVTNASYGAVNLPAKSEKACIREFVNRFPGASGDSVPSFAVALASLGDPDRVKALEERGNSREIIAYASREFVVMPIENAEERAEELIGKYVLIGALNEASDMHATPVNSYLSGIMIHAYALSTILDSCWFVTLPAPVDYAIAALLCFIVVFWAVILTAKVKGLVLRIVQILLVYLAVWGGYTLFVDHNVICNFSYTLLMLTFGLFAVDIWNGTEATIEWIGKKIEENKSKTKDTEPCENSYLS